jgi:raffinose/stachyose/melibiose transport system substrate-binding protein
MKRMFLITLVFAMTFSLAFAGGQSEEAAATEGPITLKLWHIWTNDIDAQRISVENAAKAVEAAYPNIRFEIVANSDEDHKVNLPLALVSADGPDIFYWQGAGNAEGIVSAGNVLDLTPYYKADTEQQKKLPAGSLAYTTYDDKIYGYTYGNQAAFIFYNKAMFKDYGVKVPETYEDLVLAAKTFSDAGVVPMSAAGSDLWPIMFQYASLALKEAGSEACNAALSGKGSFNSPEFIRAAEELQELAAAGFYSDSVLSVDYNGAQNAFTEGNAAMFYMGDWAAGTVVNENVGMINWPASNPSHSMDRLGGSANAFWVSSKCDYPDEAAAAVAMLTEVMSSDQTIPAYTNAVVASDNAVGQMASEVLSGSEGYTLWWDTSLGQEKGGRCNEYIVALMSGELTPQQFVTAMDGLVK